jgi:hypothetical protein
MVLDPVRRLFEDLMDCTMKSFERCKSYCPFLVACGLLGSSLLLAPLSPPLYQAAAEDLFGGQVLGRVLMIEVFYTRLQMQHCAGEVDTDVWFEWA